MHWQEVFTFLIHLQRSVSSCVTSEMISRASLGIHSLSVGSGLNLLADWQIIWRRPLVKAPADLLNKSLYCFSDDGFCTRCVWLPKRTYVAVSDLIALSIGSSPRYRLWFFGCSHWWWSLDNPWGLLQFCTK